MQQLLFRSRWFALVWAALTLISIAAFVAKGGGVEKLDKAAAELRAQREAAGRVVDSDGDPDARRRAHEEWLNGPAAAPVATPTPMVKEVIDPDTGQIQRVLVQPPAGAADPQAAPGE